MERPLSKNASASRAPTKEGLVFSKKLIGVRDNQPKWESRWTPSHMKVFNQRLRLEQGDKLKDKGNVVAWEVGLKDLKVISEPDEKGEFFITAKHDTVRLANLGETTRSISKIKRSSKFDFSAVNAAKRDLDDVTKEEVEKKLFQDIAELSIIGSSTIDFIFVLKCSKPEAEDWVNFIKLAKSKDYVKDKRVLSEFFPQTNPTKKTTGRRKKRHKIHSKNLASSLKSQTLPKDDTLEQLQGFLRCLALLLSVASVFVVGALYGTFLILSNAPRIIRRKHANRLQEVLAQAIIWILPQHTLHITGTAPTSYVSNIEYDADGNSKDSNKTSTKAKILILNRCSHADFFTIILLANQVDHAGHVRAILGGKWQTIQYIPFVGTVLTWFRVLFLTGHKWHDEPKVHSYMKRMSQEKGEWLVFFPEPGSTPITKEAINRSKRIASETGRPSLENVILPESNLLETCLLNLALSLEDDEDAEIYDMTLAYSGFTAEYGNSANPFLRETDKHVPSFFSMVFNQASRDLHIHSEMYSLRALKDVLDGHDGIETWLDEVFIQKDEKLNYFARTQTFAGFSRNKSSIEDITENSGSIKGMLYLWILMGSIAITFFLYLLIRILLL